MSNEYIKQTLNYELVAWSDNYNLNRAPIKWQFTAVDVRIKIQKLYPQEIHNFDDYIPISLSVAFACCVTIVKRWLR